MLSDDQKTIEEFEMFSLALQDSDRGIFLFRAEASEQKAIVCELTQRVNKPVSYIDATMLTLQNNRIDISFFKEWIKSEPGKCMFILYNLQTIPSPEDTMMFCHAFNYLRDELMDLHRIIIFGMSPYFATELSLHASDLYSFFGYHAHFKSMNHKSVSFEERSASYAGDVRIARERLFEMYHAIKRKGINEYDNTETALKYLLNFLESWYEIHEYLSKDLNKDVLQIMDKFENIVEVLNIQNKIDKLNLTVYYELLARITLKLGYYQKALQWFQKALDISKKVSGDEQPLTATRYNNLAGVYKELGKYEEALQWYQKALVISERVYGNEHPSTAITYNNLASVYKELDKYEEALQWCQKALVIGEKVFGNEHPSIAATYHTLGSVYKELGKYEEALLWYQKALDIYEKVYGNEHPSTAIMYNNLAGIYKELGKYKEALRLYQKALIIKEKVYGNEHPSTAITYSNLAGVNMELGEYEEALQWYQRALGISEKVYGNEHSNTKSIHRNYKDCLAFHKRKSKQIHKTYK